jgi:hypothetical protein
MAKTKDYMKKQTIFIVTLLVVLALTTTCTRLNKIYEYHESSAAYVGGIVSAKMSGTFISEGTITTQGTPYQLWISIEPSDGTGEFTVSKIRLVSKSNSEIGYVNTSIQVSGLYKDIEGNMLANFFYDKLDLEYVDYQLEVEFISTKNGEPKRAKTWLDLHRDYQEYRSNDFWDKIMSV